MDREEMIFITFQSVLAGFFRTHGTDELNDTQLDALIQLTEHLVDRLAEIY